MMADAVGTTIGKPAHFRNASIKTVYENSVKNGYKFELLTNKQVNAANAAYRKNKESNKKDIAYSEIHPQSGRAGISAKRLLTTKREARGRRS